MLEGEKPDILYLDVANLIKYIDNCSKLPSIISFGGYEPQADYGFLSRGLHPDERSFQFTPNWGKGKIISFFPQVIQIEIN